MMDDDPSARSSSDTRHAFTVLQAVNAPPGVCVNPGDPGCIPGAANGGAGALIDPAYKTPYALHASAGVQHAFGSKWMLSADWTHEAGVHAYRRYQYQAGYTLLSSRYGSDAATQQQYVPNLTVFRTDNRSRYDGLSVQLQGNVSRRFSLVFHYTLASPKTWGCVLGEIFGYVNGVCHPLRAFGPGDYGPSGEDAIMVAVPIMIFDSDTIPLDRRAELEAAVVAAGKHVQKRFEGWIVATPDRRKFAVRITSYPEVDISVPFDWNATAAEVTECVRAAMED